MRFCTAASWASSTLPAVAPAATGVASVVSAASVTSTGGVGISTVGSASSWSSIVLSPVAAWRRIANVASSPAPSTTAAAVKVSAIACAVRVSCAASSADSKSGSVSGGSSIVERRSLKRPSPQAVSAERPTDSPSRRTTITTDAAAPRWSAGALSTTALVVGATVSPNPAPSSASCRANTGYDVSALQVAPIQA